MAARPRHYHASTHPPPPGPFSSTEQALLAAAYAHVPVHGFTRHALAAGARDIGYLDISTNVLPEGVFSLILYHLVTQRSALAGRVQELFDGREDSLSVGQKVEALAWERLLGNREVIGRWQEVRRQRSLPRICISCDFTRALLTQTPFYN